MIERGWIKICGITRDEDLESVIDAGADAVGFNLWPQSPRHVSKSRAKELASRARGRIATVGVCVNLDEAELAGLAESLGLDWIQLHGDETPELVQGLGPAAFKALGIATEQDAERAMEMPGAFVLVDARDDVARGGTGKLAPTQLARQVSSQRPTVLAGGLRPDNVRERIEAIEPMGVDTASGVEVRPGVKDPIKVREFCLRAKQAFAALGDGVRDV